MELTGTTDYSSADNWLRCRLDRQHQVDLFYLYPTCYSKPTPQSPLVCSILEPAMREKAATYIPCHIACFAPVADVFAPFYRQCDAHALTELSWEEKVACFCGQPLADACAALDYYFEHWNQGRPFILAGHSQGSVILCLVLQKYFKEHPEYLARLVCAYVIGFGVTKDYLQANPHLHFATGAQDVGVIVSYNTEAPSNAGQSNSVVPPNSISINPLNWRLDEAPASVSENLGSLAQQADGNWELVPGIAQAQLDVKRGVVLCRNVSEAQYCSRRVATFGSGSFHNYDYPFYFMNLQVNARLRVQRYLELSGQGSFRS